MKVKVTTSEGRLVYRFRKEAGDGRRPGHKAQLAQDHCEVRLPVDWSHDNLHPDLAALAVLLLAYPFSVNRIEMPRAVSSGFAETASRWTRLAIEPIDPTLRPRAIPTNGYPGLAFSGGVDSTAAMLVLPQQTHLFFLDRILPKHIPSLYTPEAARHACEHLRSEGRTVHMTATDLENLRSPVGFPVEGATGVPLILLADQENINSAAFGTVMESGYRIGHEVFLDFPERAFYKRWSNIFAAAGLPLCLPVAGLSEVATSSIVLHSPYRSIAQSCVRGRVSEPCLQCYKCFRKFLLQSALDGVALSDEMIDRLLASGEVQRAILGYPVKHGNVLAFALARYQGNHPILRLLGKRVRSHAIETAWMQHWYRPSECLIPSTYRNEVAQTIQGLAGVMNLAEEGAARHWEVPEDCSEIRTSGRAIRDELQKHQLGQGRSMTSTFRLAHRIGHSRLWIWIRAHTGGPDGWLERLTRRLLRLLPARRP